MKIAPYTSIMLFCGIITAQSDHTYREYEQDTNSSVYQTYLANHTQQTVAYVLGKKAEYLPLKKGKYGIWRVLEMLNSMVDESDPDLDLPQIIHALQTAEAIRKDGHPRWLILTGLIHDCGKMLSFFGEPQWAVVGDTFPVGCAYSDKIVYPDLFKLNPDFHNPAYQTQYGIYSPGCGLSNLHMSWGHDEYLYHVVKKYLPAQAAYIIRFHSFYPWHDQGGYRYFMNEYDHEMFKWIKLFNQYDLYSKCPEEPDVQALKPYYQQLIAEFFPETIDW